MCGRYTLTADLKKVADRFGAPILVESTHPCPSEEGNDVWRTRYNIAPTQAVIVVGDDGKR